MACRAALCCMSTIMIVVLARVTVYVYILVEFGLFNRCVIPDEMLVDLRAKLAICCIHLAYDECVETVLYTLCYMVQAAKLTSMLSLSNV